MRTIRAATTIMVVAMAGTAGSHNMRRTTMKPCTTTDPATTPAPGATTMIEALQIVAVQATMTETSHNIGHIPEAGIEAVRKVLAGTRADLRTL